MSTHSRIGIKDLDGSIRSIYCHNDGYLAEVGFALYKHYKTTAVVDELVKLGDISSLSSSPADVIAYHRDMGRELDAAVVDADEEAFLATADGSDAQYAYLWAGDRWYLWTSPSAGVVGDKVQLVVALVSDRLVPAA